MPASPPANKGQRYPADVLTTEEIDALLRAELGRSSIAIRNRALIVAIYRAALRVSEAIALRPNDVDLDSGRVHVRQGKGDKSRVVALDKGALAVIGEWTERRASLGFSGRQPLFCSLKGTAIRSPYLRRLLPRLAERAGIDKRVHPHILRHSRAAELAAEGVPVNVIQAALGHSNLATTSVYLSHIAPEQVMAAMQDSGWAFDGEGDGSGKGRRRKSSRSSKPPAGKPRSGRATGERGPRARSAS